MIQRLFAAAIAIVTFAVATPSYTQDRPLRIVALGDSLTAGYRLGPNLGFVPKLEAALKARGHNVTIENAGVSGDTASAGAARLDWAVGDGVDGVIVELGANDMLRGVNPDIPRKALGQIASKLKERGVPFMLAGMYAPRNLGPEYVKAFDSIYPDLAARHDALLYPFFLDGVAGNRKLNLPDGIHPNEQGIDVIVERILPTVETFIGTIKKGR